MNAEELLKGVDIPEDAKAKLIQTLNPVFTKYEADAADATGKLKDAIETRQKAKDELRDLKEKFVNGDFDSKKEMEAQLKLKENELATLNEKTNTLEKELAGKNEELKKIETETRETLKDRFPEDKWDVIKDLPISKLRELAKLETVETPPSDKTKRLKTYGSGAKELTSEEKIATMYGKK